jgi:hypothetical protein
VRARVQADEAVSEMRQFSAAHPGAHIVVTGDFNEPSHLDWTARAAR